MRLQAQKNSVYFKTINYSYGLFFFKFKSIKFYLKIKAPFSNHQNYNKKFPETQGFTFLNMKTEFNLPYQEIH